MFYWHGMAWICFDTYIDIYIYTHPTLGIIIKTIRQVQKKNQPKNPTRFSNILVRHSTTVSVTFNVYSQTSIVKFVKCETHMLRSFFVFIIIIKSKMWCRRRCRRRLIKHRWNELHSVLTRICHLDAMRLFNIYGNGSMMVLTYMYFYTHRTVWCEQCVRHKRSQ